MNINEELDAIEKRREAADNLNAQLCDGTRRWVMSIPARPGYDPDLVFSDTAKDTERLVAALNEARKRLRETNTNLFNALPRCDGDDGSLDGWNAEDEAAILRALRGGA